MGYTEIIKSSASPDMCNEMRAVKVKDMSFGVLWMLCSSRFLLMIWFSGASFLCINTTLPSLANV